MCDGVRCVEPETVHVEAVVYLVVLFIYKLHTNTHRPRTDVTHACLGWYYLVIRSRVYI